MADLGDVFFTLFLMAKNKGLTMFQKRFGRLPTLLPSTMLAISVSLLSSQAQAEDHALLIGISQYQDGSVLPGVDKDPLLMRDIVRKMGFAENQIKLLQDRAATKAGILDSIQSWLVKGVSDTDRIVLYYSGHGYRVPDTNGDEADGCDEALVPYDKDNLLIDDELGEALAKIPAKNVLVVLDSCFSGTVTKSAVFGQTGAQGKFFSKVLQKSGEMACDKALNVTKSASGRGTGTFSVVDQSIPNSSAASPPTSQNSSAPTNAQKIIEFAAAAANEVALTDTSGSLFTLGIHEKIMNTTGPVSFAELREYAAQYVRTAVSKLGEAGFSAFHPQLRGDSQALIQDMLQFGRKAQTAPSLPSITEVNSGRELLDRYLNTSAFKVEIRGNKQQYKLGEPIRYEIYSSDDGYLNLLELDEKGNIAVLFPNRYNSNNKVVAGQINRFPSTKFGNYDFRAIEPFGTTRVVALVTTQPLNLYTTPGNVNGDFRVLLNIEHFRKMAGLLKATGVMPLPTGTTFGANSVDIKVQP